MRRLLFVVLFVAACGNSSNRLIQVLEEGPGGPDTFRVAVLHLSSYNGDRIGQEAADRTLQTNFDRVEPLVRQAAARGAKIIVTPEYINSGIRIAFSALKHVSTELPAAPTDAPVWEDANQGVHAHVRDYGRLAAELDAYIVTDVLERVHVEGEKKPRYYNSMITLDPEGKLLANYRKINRYIFERFIEHAGDETVSFDTPWGRFGMLLCFDTLVPWTWGELTRKHKVDFLITQTLWEHTPFTGHIAMNLLADLSGRTVIWSNQQRGGLGGGAGIVRPWAADTTVGIWAPPGVVIANLPVPEHLRTGAIEADISGSPGR